MHCLLEAGEIRPAEDNIEAGDKASLSAEVMVGCRSCKLTAGTSLWMTMGGMVSACMSPVGMVSGRTAGDHGPCGRSGLVFCGGSSAAADDRCESKGRGSGG